MRTVTSKGGATAYPGWFTPTRIPAEGGSDIGYLPRILRRLDRVERMTNGCNQDHIDASRRAGWDHVVFAQIDAVERVVATLSNLQAAARGQRLAAAEWQLRGADVQSPAMRSQTPSPCGHTEFYAPPEQGSEAALTPTPAHGSAEYLGTGWLTGWAHGPGYARTHVEVSHAGVVLFSWPADRPLRELRVKGIGDGAHGFRIPLVTLLGGRRPEDVVLTISGTDVVLQAPMMIARFCDGSAGLPAYADASTARLALLAAILPDACSTATRFVRLTLGVLQELLNKLSATEAAAAEQAELGALLAIRNGSPLLERLPSDPPVGEPSRAEQVLRALIAAAPNLKFQDLVPIVLGRLTAPLQAMPPAERSRLLDLVMAQGPPVLLRSCSKALQQAGFVAWPAEAARQGLRTQEPEPTLGQARLIPAEPHHQGPAPDGRRPPLRPCT